MITHLDQLCTLSLSLARSFNIGDTHVLQQDLHIIYMICRHLHQSSVLFVNLLDIAFFLGFLQSSLSFISPLFPLLKLACQSEISTVLCQPMRTEHYLPSWLVACHQTHRLA